MNKMMVIVNKEWKQFHIELKIIWLPVVFILLGMLQPIVSNYMPVILQSVSGTNGITIDPNYVKESAGTVLAGTLGSQFDQLGIIILVISLMGIIYNDKKSGMLGYILSRPISIRNYIFAKYFSNLALITAVISIGFFVSCYYSSLLFGDMIFTVAFTALLYYLVWIMFVVALVLFISGLLKSISMVAAVSIIILFVIRGIAGLSDLLNTILPSSMAVTSTEVLTTGVIYFPSLKLIISLLWTGFFLILTEKVVKERV